MTAPNDDTPIYMTNEAYDELATGLARQLLDFHCPRTEAIHRLAAANVWPVSVMDDAEREEVA